MTKTLATSLYLDEATVDRLARFEQRYGVSRSQAVRLAVAVLDIMGDNMEAAIYAAMKQEGML